MVHKTDPRKRELVETTLTEAIDYYLTALALEGKSPETIVWYRKKLTCFAVFTQDGGEPARVSALSIEEGRAFVKSIMERKTKYANHIFRSIKPPKVPQILIQPLTEDEIRRVLAAIPPHTPEGVRNYAITLLFLDSGIRLRELLNLKISDIDFAVGQFKVLGKGAKERIVPMGMTARRAVIRYLEHFRPQPVNPQESKLFLTVAGDPITVESVEQMIRRLAKRSGVPRLHPHLLRHSFAVRYLVNGGDVFTLQKILGHTTLEMTRKYVTLASGDVKEKHRQYSPIDNLGLVERKLGRPKKGL
jgi:integrase/recombinase XerC/integrase/recombinase XerD